MVRLYLKEWRDFKGLSNLELASRVGMNPTTLYRMEAEQFRWTAEHLEQLALGLDLDDPRKLLYPPS